MALPPPLESQSSSPSVVSSSAVSPTAAVPPDGSSGTPKREYFPPQILRLDTITEHDEFKHNQVQEDIMPPVSRQVSLSGISFRAPSVAVGHPVTITDSAPRLERTLSWGQPKHRKDRIRESSPPAPSRFKPHVSFDNFAGGEPTDRNTIALTLNVKHTGYQYKKRSRTFMVGLDEHDYSDTALRWTLDELVDDGDEIVCIRVVDKDAKISGDKSMEKKQYLDEAKQIMKDIQRINEDHRAISIVLEFAVGKLSSTFQAMIQLYEPAMLIVGTKGRSLGGLQGLVGNRHSFSKWCLQYSPIPVVVVRPDEKREKKKLKRLNDPTRANYKQILIDSGQKGHETSHDHSASTSTIGINTLPQNHPDLEAHAVAAALGLPARFDPTLKPMETKPSSQRAPSEKSSVSRAGAHRSPDRPASPALEPKSPELMTQESPMVSDEEGEDSEDDDVDAADFEAVPGEALLENEPEAIERKERLHRMEVGEAAALAGRKVSVCSSASGGGPDDEGSPG